MIYTLTSERKYKNEISYKTSIIFLLCLTASWWLFYRWAETCSQWNSTELIYEDCNWRYCPYLCAFTINNSYLRNAGGVGSTTIGAKPFIIYVTVPTPNILAIDVLLTGILWLTSSTSLKPSSSLSFLSPLLHPARFSLTELDSKWRRTASFFIHGKVPMAHYVGDLLDPWQCLGECSEEKSDRPYKEWSPDSRHAARILGTVLIHIRRNCQFK
jgi:hypothetical protein